MELRLFDVGFADGRDGDEPVLLNLDDDERAMYMRGWNEGRLVCELLER